MATLRIKDIAMVQTGYSFRSRIERSTAAGGGAIIQMKDLGQDNVVSCRDLVKVDMDAVKNHHLVCRGDLVFRSRGQTTTSAVLLEDPGAAVVAAPLLRIRITKPDQVLPKYLNWTINQRDAQAFLASRAKGTTQKMISKQAIEELPVLLPPLARQRAIIELAALSAQEQALLHALADKRGHYISTKLTRFAQGE